MKNNIAEKYTTYILELIRNNGIIDEEIKEEKENRISSCNFLLFDYFDVLYCRKLTGEDKKYLNYLSIENVFEETIQHNEDYRVSYKTLSLYCKSEDEQSESAQENSDFFEIQSEGTTLSATPFLGIIQISLCRDNYILDNKKSIVDIDIDVFLREHENRILAIADACKPADDGIKMRRVLFRSSTTGDFCLAIRTNLIKLIYDIAIALNGTQNDPDAKSNMLTFTNVGIECKYVEGSGYATLDADVVRKNSEKIALRFSADESIRVEIEQYKKNKGNAAIEGLFGRYEYLMTITMEEFTGLYPFLCENKLGRTKKDREKTDLENILSRSLARNINERILIEIGPDKSYLPKVVFGRKKEKKEKEEKDEIFAANKKLLENIEELKRYKNLFQEEHFAFQDLIRGMIEIYKSFSSSGMDKESYINWRIFHRDMDVLCRCIREMMKNYENWLAEGVENDWDKKWYRSIILGDWRENLNAINRYTTLVQNVNYQTYQSPSYEIQTQIDAEKEMVAYREAMELYITDAMETLRAEGLEEEDSKVYPLIYPDLSKDKVTVGAPFRVRRPEGKLTAREIICTVPSFEYFARLYDLLPWIIHETSHHLRVTNREDRNRFVTDYVFFNVFNTVMREPLRKLSDCDFYEADGKAERFLITCMTKVASEEIESKEIESEEIESEEIESEEIESKEIESKEMASKDEFKKYNLDKLILEIEKWLKAMFPLDAGYNAMAQAKEEKTLRERRFGFWLDAYRKEQMLNQDSLCLILKVWDMTSSLEEEQELERAILERYYEHLENELGDGAQKFKVSLKDMNNRVLMQKKLAKLAAAEEEERVAVQEYYEQIIAVYRIKKYKSEVSDKNEEKVRKYFKKVFELYKKDYEKEIAESNTIVDTVSMHILRNLGLLHGDKDDFTKEMIKIARTVNYSQVAEHKEIWQRTYLETYADILMAASLQLTAFGYCRQVLQTASDAKLSEREDEYEDINYERWRTVAAVLLAKSKRYRKLESGEYQKFKADEMLEVDAKQLIKDAQVYCKCVIIHISEKLSKVKGLELEGEHCDRNEKRRELLRKLLRKIATQMTRYLVRSEDRVGKVLLLDILLHDEKEITNEKVRKEWNQYKEVVGFCDDVKYNFWRLACFCKGIVNIVKDGKIIVSAKLFYHMMGIREKVKDGETDGCKWERNNKCLVDPKRDVGNFYNDPQQVCDKTPDQKLENTIDFIQNYYYYNRFRVANDAFDFKGTEESDIL